MPFAPTGQYMPAQGKALGKKWAYSSRPEGRKGPPGAGTPDECAPHLDTSPPFGGHYSMTGALFDVMIPVTLANIR